MSKIMSWNTTIEIYDMDEKCSIVTELPEHIVTAINEWITETFENNGDE